MGALCGVPEVANGAAVLRGGSSHIRAPSLSDAVRLGDELGDVLCVGSIGFNAIREEANQLRERLSSLLVAVIHYLDVALCSRLRSMRPGLSQVANEGSAARVPKARPGTTSCPLHAPPSLVPQGQRAAGTARWGLSKVVCGGSVGLFKHPARLRRRSAPQVTAAHAPRTHPQR